MVLVDWQIREAIEKGYIKVDPFREDLINPQSLDIRLGDTYTKVKQTHPSYSVNPLEKSTFSDFTVTKAEYTLQPLETVLVSMLERIELAPNIMAKLMGKSSLGRLGLLNSVHAGLIDGGFVGFTTMELTNVAEYPILLTKEMRVGQFVFFETDTPSKDYQQVGRYLNQQAGAGSLGL